MYKTEPKIVGYKYTLVKKPLMMTISSYAMSACPKGKVWVTVDRFGSNVKARGLAKI